MLQSNLLNHTHCLVWAKNKVVCFLKLGIPICVCFLAYGLWLLARSVDCNSLTHKERCDFLCFLCVYESKSPCFYGVKNPLPTFGVKAQYHHTVPFFPNLFYRQKTQIPLYINHLSFENFVKSMMPCLSKLKVTPI